MLNCKITFCTVDANIYDELCRQFDPKEYPNITILKQDIRKCPPHDCIVSPANSFGLMDGGIDEYIAEIMGQDTVEKVQQEIIRKYYGEQPVGTCLLVPTGNKNFLWLAHAPTMRNPTNIKDTENAYTAFSAVLSKISRNNISSLLTTTFCTGSGRMPARRAVAQMKAAYDRIYMFQEVGRDSLDWGYASLVSNLVGSTRFK